MFAEYAVEPRVVIDWRRWQLLLAVGVTKGRLIVRFPKKWEKEVLKVAEELNIPDIERARVADVLERLRPYVRRSSAVYDDAQSWLKNAVMEHGRDPFDAILAHSNPAQELGATICEDLSPDHPFLAPVQTVFVRRHADDMTKAVAPLLRLSKKLVFVDPYFQPEKPGRWQASIPAMLKAAMLGRVAGSFPAVVEIHASAHIERVDRSDFVEECQKWSELLPAGVSVRFRLLREKGAGAALHDRVLLTDRAAVDFSTGLDQGSNSRLEQKLTIHDDQAWQRLTSQHLGEFGDRGAFNEAIHGGVLVAGE